MKFDYSRIYLKFHSDTPEHIQRMMDYYTSIWARFLPSDRKAKTLDIGCGMGFALMALRRLGFDDVVGVESDQSQATSCRAKGLKVDLTSNTLTYLQERAGQFDVILALDLIEHIPVGEQLPFVHAVFNALAPRGVLICTVPNANSTLASRYRYICWTHTSAFTEHSLDFLLFNAGFEDIQVSGYDAFKRPRYPWLPIGGTRHWWAFRFFRLVRRLQMMAELGPEQGRAVPLSLNLLGVARKA
jgi:SAM-dependent methyltransferase